MTPLKLKRAFALAGIPNMPMTRRHILDNITSACDADTLGVLSSKGLAALISAATRSYHDGRASKGPVEMVDGDCVWVGAGVDKLLPLAALRAVNITSATEPFMPHGVPTGSNWHITRYALDYEEHI